MRNKNVLVGQPAAAGISRRQFVIRVASVAAVLGAGGALS